MTQRGLHQRQLTQRQWLSLVIFFVGVTVAILGVIQRFGGTVGPAVEGQAELQSPPERGDEPGAAIRKPAVATDEPAPRLRDGGVWAAPPVGAAPPAQPGAGPVAPVFPFDPGYRDASGRVPKPRVIVGEGAQPLGQPEPPAEEPMPADMPLPPEEPAWQPDATYNAPAGPEPAQPSWQAPAAAEGSAPEAVGHSAVLPLPSVGPPEPAPPGDVASSPAQPDAAATAAQEERPAERPPIATGADGRALPGRIPPPRARPPEVKDPLADPSCVRALSLARLRQQARLLALEQAAEILTDEEQAVRQVLGRVKSDWYAAHADWEYAEQLGAVAAGTCDPYAPLPAPSWGLETDPTSPKLKEKIAPVVAVFKSMKPKPAAKILATWPPILAATVLEELPARVAGPIASALEVQLARDLTFDVARGETLTGR